MAEQDNQQGDNVAGDKHVHHHYPGAPQQPIGLKAPKFQVSKLPTTNNPLFGREAELDNLNQAWQQHTHIYILQAMGGAGKTALMNQWLKDLAAAQFAGAQAVYTWSFYSQGSAEAK